MKNNSNKKKIWFIVLVSVFGVLWATSLVFLGISALSESATESIENWYANTFADKTLNLAKVSMWSTVISTFSLVVTLLAKEIKKRYVSK